MNPYKVELTTEELEALVEWHKQQEEDCAEVRRYEDAHQHFVRGTALRTIVRAPDLAAEQAAEGKIEAHETAQEVEAQVTVDEAHCSRFSSDGRPCLLPPLHKGDIHQNGDWHWSMSPPSLPPGVKRRELRLDDYSVD